jgi:hypothetical protein
MAVEANIILLIATIITNFLFIYQEHRILSGIITILTGAATYLIMTDNNPYGLIIIAIGLIVTINAPIGPHR